MLLQKQFLIEVHIDFESSILNLIQISLTKFLFLGLGLQKRIALVYFFKMVWGYMFLKGYDGKYKFSKTNLI